MSEQIKAVMTLDKATNQCFLDKCYHKTIEDAEKYLKEYEKMGGRPREDWDSRTNRASFRESHCSLDKGRNPIC